MSDLEWNSVTVAEDEKPRVSMEDLREMAESLDPDDYDESVQVFLADLMMAKEADELKQVATMLLQDEVGFSPDMAAMGVEPDEDLVALLISCGADVNATNPYGETPLHMAARYGYTSLVEMLLAAGAARHLHNHAGKTPAEVAADPALSAFLAPLSQEEAQLPPEVLDADYAPAEDDGEHHHHGHDCHCGHCRP